LGYAYRVVSLNSMHAQLSGPPAPQSRDRLYIVAWPQGERAPDLDRALSPRAWCGRCERLVESRQAWKPGRSVGRYKAQYVYACPTCGDRVEPGWLPASTAIDWTLPAERIADRKRPLSDKTMARIREGLRRYGAQPLVMRNNSGGAEMSTPAWEPMRTLTTAGHQSALMPRGAFLTQFRERVRNLDPYTHPLNTIVADGANYGLIVEAGGNQYDSHDPKHPQHGQPGAYSRVWPTDEPLRTLHTTATKGLLIPVEGRDGKRAASTAEAMRTQTCRNETGLLVPSGGTWHEDAYPTGDPLRTITTRENHGLLVPYYSGSDTARPSTEPLGTLTTIDRYALVTLRGQNAPKPITAPLDTFAASGTHHGLMSITEDDVMACRFRMLEPSEIAAGMAFPADYRWQGTKRERVRLAGNAVTPPASRDLITVVAESMEAA
jgi:DNA (cytosine-5)-methyltransferase 1